MNQSQALLSMLRVGLLSLIGVGLSCLSLSVHALALAGIEVQSNKGEPLRAEISVSSATAEEWGQLVVRVAPADRFAQLGLVFTPAVGQLQAELLETADGNKRIRLLSLSLYLSLCRFRQFDWRVDFHWRRFEHQSECFHPFA